MDNKDLEKIEIVKKYLGRAFTASTYHVYGDIPRKKFNKACQEYAGTVPYDECIGLTDETIFGSGSRGFLFTLDGFYYNGCSGKSYYRDGHTFNSLGSLYNLSAFNEMLDKLYGIETKKGFLDSLIDGIGMVADAYIENKISEYENEQKRKEQEENEEVIEALENINTFLREIDGQITVLMDYDFDDVELDDYYNTLVRLASALSNDKNLFDRLSDDTLTEEDEEYFESLNETLEMIFEMLMMEDEEYESIDLKKSIKAFRSSVISIFDDLYYEDDSEPEELFQKSQKSLGKLHSKFKSSIKRINIMIEMALEED